MAVVRNLMIRIGADFSPAEKGMRGAGRALDRFKRDAERTTSTVTGRRGLGGAADAVRRFGRDVQRTTADARGNRGLRGLAAEFANTGRSVSASMARMRSARGIGGVVSELGNLRGAAGAARGSMLAFGAAGASVAARLGPVGIVIGAVVIGLGLMTKALQSASQTAAQFEADLGRLNISLKSGAQGYMQWARAQGLAKTTAADMGATYGNLLGSFISDTDELQKQTQDLVQATRVITSYTGRSMDDVFNRIRSGMLGSTEAIEDLGVYVNISMIESTEAFRRFAGDKSWAQLDFQTQQQIRLAAILEQTYARYGKSLQDNVMTKQTELSESFKDLKLHLSQIALPIWEAVIPALKALVEGISWVAEQVARFVHWVLRKEYEGVSQVVDQTDNLNSGLDETEKAAKKAQKALAGFDQLNLIGGGSGEGSGTGGTGGSGGGSGGGGSGNKRPGIQFPNLPVVPPGNVKGLAFDPPQPPDMGAGAAAVAATTTINQMIATMREKTAQMWNEMQKGNLSAMPLISGQWTTFYAGLAAKAAPVLANIRADWRLTLSTMTDSIRTHSPTIAAMWGAIGNAVAGVKTPLSDVRIAWKEALSDMQQTLNAYRPYLEWGWHLIAAAIRNVENPLADVKVAWKDTLDDMLQQALSIFGSILSQIATVVNGLNNLKNALPGVKPNPVPVPQPTPQPQPDPNAALQAKRDAFYETTPAPVAATGALQNFMDSFKRNNAHLIQGESWSLLWERLKAEANKPQNKAAMTALSMLPAGRAIGAAGSATTKLDDLWRALSEMLKGRGSAAVPAMATGTNYVPRDMLAYIHEGEAVVPKEFNPAAGGGMESREVVAVLRQILTAVKQGGNVQVSISQDALGRTVTDWQRDQQRMTGRTAWEV